MPKPPLANVLSHWSKLIENFHTSTLEYYTAVEAALAQRQIPGIKTSRVDFQEGGALSARREYLRVTRKDLSYDICGAPFGTGFFFSWWLIETPRLRTFLRVALILAVIGILMHVQPGFFRWLYIRLWRVRGVGNIAPIFPFLLLVPLALWLLHWIFLRPLEARILATPGLGHIYQRLFRPMTYYHVDTMLMFRASVQAAVLEVIDGLTAAKGLRALTEDERKPIMRDFFRR